MLAARIAAFGPIVAHPVPDVFRRHHPQQDSRRFTTALSDQRMIATTGWMLDHAPVDRAALLAALNDRLTRCPGHAIVQLRDELHGPWCLPYLQTALGKIEIQPRWRMPDRSIVRRALRAIANRVLPRK
jgi:hypothetical protein